MLALTPSPTVAPTLHGRPAGVGGRQRQWEVRGASLTIVVDDPAKAQHGRVERRILWTLADPAQNARLGDTGSVGQPGCPVGPHVQQVCRIEHRRIRQQTAETATEVTYAITSLPADQADAPALLALARGHWGIENKTHYVRDRVPFGPFDDDRSQIHSGAAPQAFAALRTNAGRPYLAIKLILAPGRT